MINSNRKPSQQIKKPEDMVRFVWEEEEVPKQMTIEQFKHAFRHIARVTKAEFKDRGDVNNGE